MSLHSHQRHIYHREKEGGTTPRDHKQIGSDRHDSETKEVNLAVAHLPKINIEHSTLPQYKFNTLNLKNSENQSIHRRSNGLQRNDLVNSRKIQTSQDKISSHISDNTSLKYKIQLERDKDRAIIEMKNWATTIEQVTNGDIKLKESDYSKLLGNLYKWMLIIEQICNSYEKNIINTQKIMTEYDQNLLFENINQKQVEEDKLHTPSRSHLIHRIAPLLHQKQSATEKEIQLYQNKIKLIEEEIELNQQYLKHAAVKIDQIYDVFHQWQKKYRNEVQKSHSLLSHMGSLINESEDFLINLIEDWKKDELHQKKYNQKIELSLKHLYQHKDFYISY